MQRVELFAALQTLLAHGHVADDGSHACHRLAQFVAGELDFLALALEFLDDGVALLPGLLVLVDAVAPDDDNDDEYDDVEREHPPGEPPGTVHVDVEDALLIADGTVGTDGLDVEAVVATAQAVELDAVEQGVAIAPVVVKSLHPVHELQALALVVVAGGKLDGDGALAVVELYLVAFVECLGQDDVAVVVDAGEYLLFADKQLCQHDTGQ